MIDISISTHRDNEAIKQMKDLAELKGIVLYCDASLFTYEDDVAFTPSASIAAFEKSFCSEQGYHYAIDAKDIISCVPDNKQTEHLQGGKNTYINKIMYDNKANEKSISVIMMIPNEHQYKDIENKTIKFLAHYLVEKDLEPDCIMREFDLNQVGSPLHLLDESKWKKFISAVETTYKYMKEEQDDEDIDKYIEDLSSTYTDEEINEFYVKNGQKAEEYSQNFEPDNRNIEELLNNNSSSSTAEIDGFVTANKTAFSYAVTQNSPGAANHCVRAYDSLTSKATPDKQLEVEPIYPDLVVPPGGSITLTSNLTSSNAKPLSNVLSLEELEKREKTFNIKDYKDAKKVVNGKPVNNNDPYPVDDKIKELESHQPKLKIDEVNSNLHDCNHPGSIIGPAVAKNFAMVQDEIITLAKRTERRMVKVENILATMMRNIFRIGSRMNINCVYYGGQDVYGKYKCIRCLHDDRINDGQSMTLDQCMNCTRYEPILGQVYAILDENATNLSQVLDDIQMAYMTMDEYAQFTRTEEMHSEAQYADITNNPTEQPKTFSELYKEKYETEEEAEGFKMDWSETQLENERPNIAEYNAEGIEAKKPIIEDENQGTVEPEFKNTITEEETYEIIKYNSEDYNFNSFGTSYATVSGINTNGYFGKGGAQIRKDIVAYAQQAYELCKEGKAGYSQDKRYAHLDNAINGISYWDCSSLVEGAYKAANITSVTGTTYDEYPVCKSTAGGILIPVSDMDNAIEGDIVFCTNQSPIPTGDAIENATIKDIYHVGIYIGNGQYIHASTSNAELTKQIKCSEVSNNSKIFAFGRPKELVEADKLASTFSASDSFDPDIQKLPNDLREPIKTKSQSFAQGVINNNQKWNYAPIFISVCEAKSQEYGIDIDPYMMMAMSGVESSGDPYCGGPDPGLMQLAPESGGAAMPSYVAPGSSEATAYFTKQISGAVDHLMGKRKDIIALCGEDWGTWPIVIYGYNSGQGTVYKTIKAYNLSPMTGGEFAPHLKNYVASSGIIPLPQVRYEYFARVLWTYQILKTSI